MRIKAKYLWTIFLAFLAVFGWFGLPFYPKDSRSAIEWLTYVDAWVIGHTVYPSIFFLAIALFLGAVLIPEAWVMAKEALFPTVMVPDIDGATVFKEILAKSKRAKKLITPRQLRVPLRYESHLTNEGVIEGRLKVQLADEFHDRLRWGAITAWGTPDGKKPHQQIKPEEWSEIMIDFDEQDMNYDPPHVHSIQRKSTQGSHFPYLWLKFNHKQVLKEFPSALWPRKRPSGTLTRT